MLQAWYKSHVPQDKRARDRTTELANKIWAEKVEARKMIKDLESGGKGVGGVKKGAETASRPSKEVEKTKKRTAEATTANAKSTANA
jgi:hypothetical protein